MLTDQYISWWCETSLDGHFVWVEICGFVIGYILQSKLLRIIVVELPLWTWPPSTNLWFQNWNEYPKQLSFVYLNSCSCRVAVKFCLTELWAVGPCRSRIAANQNAWQLAIRYRKGCHQASVTPMRRSSHDTFLTPIYLVEMSIRSNPPIMTSFHFRPKNSRLSRTWSGHNYLSYFPPTIYMPRSCQLLRPNACHLASPGHDGSRKWSRNQNVILPRFLTTWRGGTSGVR